MSLAPYLVAGQHGTDFIQNMDKCTQVYCTGSLKEPESGRNIRKKSSLPQNTRTHKSWTEIIVGIATDMIN